jgi:pyruvate dehydrogenase (quinone)
MGAKGIRLEEPGDVKDALSEALAYKDGPVVVDAVVDRFALSLPSHVPLHTAQGYTLSFANGGRRRFPGRPRSMSASIYHSPRRS